METEQRPMVGVGVLIFKDNKVLIGKRTSSHGSGEYGATGGHLEHLEAIEACAKRETREETGIEIKNVKFLCAANVIKYAPKHYINIVVTADWASGEPEALEPHKIESWNWYDLDNLPAPLFDHVGTYLQALKTKEVFFDA